MLDVFSEQQMSVVILSNILKSCHHSDVSSFGTSVAAQKPKRKLTNQYTFGALVVI